MMRPHLPIVAVTLLFLAGAVPWTAWAAEPDLEAGKALADRADYVDPREVAELSLEMSAVEMPEMRIVQRMAMKSKRAMLGINIGRGGELAREFSVALLFAGPEGFVGDAAQAQPDPDREPDRPRPGGARRGHAGARCQLGGEARGEDRQQAEETDLRAAVPHRAPGSVEVRVGHGDGCADLIGAGVAVEIRLGAPAVDKRPVGRGGPVVDPAIDLRAITTCLTFGRPFEIPFEQDIFAFDPVAWRRLFPERIVAHLERTADARRASTLARDGRLPLPRLELPVVVADRILDGPRSVVIQEARNRMLAQMAVLHQMLGSGA